MKANIQNYRGVASATLDLTAMALIAGPNGAGKSSVAQALASAFTGEAVPIPDVKKSQAGILVRSGTPSGRVKVATDNGATEVTWPNAKVTTTGQPPWASHYAAGLSTIVDLDDKKRVEVLTEYLSAAPTRADLDEHLEPLGLPVGVLDKLWQLIEMQGWDGALKQVKEKGARFKGQWESTAGDRYGSKKAESYVPIGYEPDLDGASEAALKAIITDAMDYLESAIASEAVGEDRLEVLRASAAQVPELKQALEDVSEAKLDELKKALEAIGEKCDDSHIHTLKRELEELERKTHNLKSALEALPGDGQPIGMDCPKCGTSLQREGHTLTAVVMISNDIIEERKKAVDAAYAAWENAGEEAMVKSKALGAATDQLRTENQKIDRETQAARSAVNEEQASVYRLKGEASALIKVAESAAAELATATDTPAGAPVDECRTALARSETRLGAWKAKTEADRIHQSIIKNQELVKHLAADGIRGTVLAGAIDGFNSGLLQVCNAAGWLPIELNMDFKPTLAGAPYALLCESEKFRVRVVLRLAMAKLDNSQSVIIDAADILDAGNRNGLFKAVRSIGLPTLICMTMDAAKLMPNLEKAGIGKSYWLQPGGVVVDLKKALEV